jgi:predicted nucleotidyltransferase
MIKGSRIDILIDSNKKKKLKLALTNEGNNITDFLSEKIDSYLDNVNFSSYLSSNGTVCFDFKNTKNK